MNELDKTIMEATESTDSKKEDIKKSIKERIPILQNQIKEFDKRLNDFKYLDIQSDIVVMLKETEELKIQAEDYFA